MSHELVWTVVPNGIAAGGQPRISIVVSPRLEPGASGTTADFPDFAAWPTRVARDLSLQIVIGGTTVPLPAPLAFEPGTEPDQALWDALFGSTSTPPAGAAARRGVPVHRFTAAPPASPIFRSFPVRDVADGFKDRYASSIVRGLAQGGARFALPPGAFAPGGSPSIVLPDSATEAYRRESADAVARFDDWSGADVRLAPMKALALQRLSESARDNLTPATLQAIADDIAGTLGIAPPTIVPAPAAAGAVAFQRALVRAASFHAVRARGMAAAVPTPPPADIHELLKYLTAYPALQRKLGLILDLVVPVTAASLPAEGTLRATAQFARPPANTTFLQPSTAYARSSSPPRFVARGRTALIKNGLLDVSDQSRFFLETLDVDGAALKAAYMRDAAQDAAPRTGGIALVFKDKAHFITDLMASAASAASDLSSATLFAEDLMRGVRLDVHDEAPNRWKSLHERLERFALGTLTMPPTWPLASARPHRAEGYVRLSVTTPLDAAPEINELDAHEVLARWEGWSLAVPMPQKAAPSTLNAAIEDRKDTPVLAVTPQYSVVEGSLPRLLFGRRYRIRARIVDLAGNSVTLQDAGTGFDQSAGGPEGGPLVYRRFEPLESPRPLVLGLLDRDDCPARHVDRLVVSESTVTDDRAIAPGRVTRKFAGEHQDYIGMKIGEREGAFEGAFLNDDGSFVSIEDPAEAGGAAHAAFLYQPSNAEAPSEPYLPDPLCEGARLVLADVAGQVVKSASPLQISYYRPDRQWPRAQPLIVELTRAARAALDGTVPVAAMVSERVRPPFDSAASVALRPGEMTTLRLASYAGSGIAQAPGSGHHLLALWDLTRRALAAHQEVPAAAQRDLDETIAAAGVPEIAPALDLILVHAVRRPLAATLQSVSVAPRVLNDTSVRLTCRFSIHRTSTGRIDGVAHWPEYIDRISEPSWRIEQRPATIFRSQVALEPTGAPGAAGMCRLEDEQIGGVVHAFGDTRHRSVTYRGSGFTRFREYFAAGQNADDQFVTDAGEKPIEIPSTARPDAPAIAYVIPVFEWSSEPKVPLRGKTSHRLGGTLRIYLERPWFSSGGGELLAVVLLAGRATDGELADRLATAVTRWGGDPLWTTAALADLPTQDDFRGGIRPPRTNGQPAVFTLPKFEAAGDPRFAIVAFKPEFDEARRMWRVDIPMRVTGYTPFVRLALARYQPDSIANCELSAPVLADFAQLTPDRHASLTYGTRDTDVTLTVTGVTYQSSAAAMPPEMRVHLEEQYADVHADTGWHRVDPSRYHVRSNSSPAPAGATSWRFEIALPASRKQRRYRLVIEEAERLPQDTGNVDPTRTIPGDRITYVDVLGI